MSRREGAGQKSVGDEDDLPEPKRGQSQQTEANTQGPKAETRRAHGASRPARARATRKGGEGTRAKAQKEGEKRP
eukprot:357165-Alexandrium_andersonii.AAC.1